MAKKPISCVFMGSDPIAYNVLQFLHEGNQKEKPDFKLDAVFTQPDRRTGRGKKLTANAIKEWALDAKIPVFQPERIDENVIAQFREKQYQLCIVMAYGHIIPKGLLGISEFGFFNLHASLLPELRGASPIETAIVCGHKETGVTLMKMTAGLDSGPIIDQEKVLIPDIINALELRQKIAQACYPLLARNLDQLTTPPMLKPQENERATYCRIIDKKDGYLDFSLTTQEILDHIRGFYPWPGAILDIEGIALKIYAAKRDLSNNLPKEAVPGSYQIEDKRWYVKAQDGWIELLQIQKPGGKILNTQSFLNGAQIPSQGIIQFPERYPLIQAKYFKKPA